jgi:hypothetical protein
MPSINGDSYQRTSDRFVRHHEWLGHCRRLVAVPVTVMPRVGSDRLPHKTAATVSAPHLAETVADERETFPPISLLRQTASDQLRPLGSAFVLTTNRRGTPIDPRRVI